MTGIRDKDWDRYWKEAKAKRSLYSTLAEFYRKFIISRAVKFYFQKYFEDTKKNLYLHAGCGSGESDHRIGFKDTGFVLMDISPEALRLAERNTNLKNVNFVCGDIFNLPLGEGQFDGIWNLGVMEHFTEDARVEILKEFKRVLKDGGKCILFWPPKYGLSVIALSAILFVTNKIFRRSLKFYPDEISRFSTKRWADGLFKKAGLNIKKTYFNGRDLFTHVVLIGEKVLDER